MISHTLRMERSEAQPEPIVIYRTVNGNGETFALKPSSARRIRDHFHVEPRPRVFIAHDTKADFDAVRGDVVNAVIELLARVTKDELSKHARVEFQDPVLDTVLRVS